jgi:hypothetical protein
MRAPYYIEPGIFSHEVQKEFPKESYFALIKEGAFHKVFTVIEIFLDLIRDADWDRQQNARLEIGQAFSLSGSVYEIRNNQIELIVDENLAKKLEEAKGSLASNKTAFERFFKTVGLFLGRKIKSEDAVKDVFIAFEDYLKDKTGAKDYGSAVASLEKSGKVSATQKALLDKIYAYRSDSYGVGHAGNGAAPGEVDALWFIETVTPQILLIDRKLKSNV